MSYRVGCYILASSIEKIGYLFYLTTGQRGFKGIFYGSAGFLYRLLIAFIGNGGVVDDGSICIFLYKNRKLQFRLSVLGAVFSFAFLFLEYLKVEEFKQENSVVSGSYQLGALLPILMVVFFVLAARGIYKDEKLVRSLDRLR